MQIGQCSYEEVTLAFFISLALLSFSFNFLHSLCIEYDLRARLCANATFIQWSTSRSIMTDEKQTQQPSEVVEGPEEALTPHHSKDDSSKPRFSESSEKRQATFNQSPSLEDGEPGLDRIPTHISTHDAVAHHRDEHYEAGDEIYNKFTHLHKVSMVTVLSFCSFLAPMSSTTILAASPEVVATYNTTGSIFGISNALYMIFMGLSALLYGPLGTTYGRRWPLIIAVVSFTAFSAGNALAPNLASYFIFRMVSHFGLNLCTYLKARLSNNHYS